MLNNGSRIDGVYNECLVVWVGDHSWGWGWLYVWIFRNHYWPAQSATHLYWQQEGPMFWYPFYVVCCWCNVFTTPRAGPQSKPLLLVLFQFIILHILLPNAYTDVSDIIWWEPKTSIMANVIFTIGFKKYIYHTAITC